MPLYEYTCQSCHHQFELLIGSGEEPCCPECDDRKLTKHFSVPAAHVRSGSSLPICESPSGGTCGLPACAQGGCHF